MSEIIIEDDSWNVLDSADFDVGPKSPMLSYSSFHYPSLHHHPTTCAISSTNLNMTVIKSICFILLIVFIVGIIGLFLFSTIIQRESNREKEIEIAYGAAGPSSGGSASASSTNAPSFTLPNDVVEIKKKLSDVPTWTQIPNEEFQYENDEEPLIAHDNLYTDNLHEAALNEIGTLEYDGIGRDEPCIPSDKVPCSQSVAWEPKFIGCQSTVIEPPNGNGVPLYHKYPEIWFRNLNDEIRERSLRNAEEWDYYKYFNGRQKFAQFISSNVLNQRDQYMRPISSFEESYAFGNPLKAK